MSYFEAVEEFLLIDDLAHLLPDRTVCPFLAHGFLHLNEEVLLRTQNGARPGDSDPSDEVSCRKVVVFHRVEANQSASTPKTSFAMHS